MRGNTISPRHEDLQIIEDEVYEKAQIIVNQRSKKKKDSQLDEKRVVIRTWLFGLVYCAQCEAKMSFTTNSSKRTGSDGVVHQYSYGRFICANSAMKRSECGGQGTFSSDKVEKKACIELSNVLKKIKSEKQISKMEDRLISDEKAAAKRIRTLKHDLGSAEKELADLYEMVAPSLKDDESVKKRINTEINNKKIHIDKLEEAIEAAKQKKVMITQQIKEIRPCYNELLEMADSFGDSNNHEKAFIVSKLIDKIEVGRGLSSGIELHIKYNSNYVDLINGI